ncbi:hypothetical protein pb186bvf_017920 [Paramecium bursaria]
MQQKLSYNPFNPYKTYREFKRTDNVTQSQEIEVQDQCARPQSSRQYNSKDMRLIKTDTNFKGYMNQLKRQHSISTKLLSKHKKFIKEKVNINDALQEKDGQMNRIKLMLEQERQQIAAGEDKKEDFEKNKQKQIRVWKIKNFVQKTKKLKVQYQITEVINEIKDPSYHKKAGRYLINDDKDREKKLAKPLFFGIQSQTRQNLQKQNKFAKIDLNSLSAKIFFDEFDPFLNQRTSQQSVYNDKSFDHSPLKDQINQLFSD